MTPNLCLSLVPVDIVCYTKHNKHKSIEGEENEIEGIHEGEEDVYEDFYVCS